VESLMQVRTDVKCVHARRKSLHTSGLGVDGGVGREGLVGPARLDLTRKRVKQHFQRFDRSRTLTSLCRPGAEQEAKKQDM
jgi:hypothetical protein